MYGGKRERNERKIKRRYRGKGKKGKEQVGSEEISDATPILRHKQFVRRLVNALLLVIRSLLNSFSVNRMDLYISLVLLAGAVTQD